MNKSAAGDGDRILVLAALPLVGYLKRRGLFYDAAPAPFHAITGLFSCCFDPEEKPYVVKTQVSRDLIAPSEFLTLQPPQHLPHPSGLISCGAGSDPPSHLPPAEVGGERHPLTSSIDHQGWTGTSLGPIKPDPGVFSTCAVQSG